MIFSEANAIVSLYERLRNLSQKRRRPVEVGSQATRFVQLFEAHGVHRNQISRIFGHGLTPQHLHSTDALMQVLSDEMLNTAAELFAVRREWLDGASAQVYPFHDFYKHPDRFASFIDGLRAVGTGTLRGVVLRSTSRMFEETALIVLEEEIGAVGTNLALYRYHICRNWLFDYWKSRAFLTACIAYACRTNVWLIGREVPIELLRKYRDGEQFLEYQSDGALPTSGRQWYPEYLALEPAQFLDGLAEGRFGTCEGLRMWLQLESEGWMETGLPHENVRLRFQRALRATTLER